MAKVESIEDLKRAQAASHAMGGSGVTNYYEWQQIKEDLEKLGVKPTGSLAGDKKRLAEKIEEEHQKAQEAQKMQAQQAQKPENDEYSKTNEKTSQDKEQQIKANVANNVSAEIMADYMKYYHLS